GSSPINSSNTCINKKLLIDVGLFPIEIEQQEDLTMWIRIALKGELFAFSSKILVHIYRDTQSKLERARRGLYEQKLPLEDILMYNSRTALEDDAQFINRAYNKLCYMRGINALYSNSSSITKAWAKKMTP